MKNKILILLISFLAIPVLSVKAYQNPYFEIEMPSGYDATNEQNGTYQWKNTNNDSNYIVSVQFRTEEKRIAQYTSEEQEKLVNDIIESLKNQYYEDYNTDISVQLTENKTVKYHSYDAYYIKLGVENFLSTGRTMTQSIYIIETKNLIYSVIYSAYLDSMNTMEAKIVENSFVIKDQLYEASYIKWIEFGGVSLVSLIVGYVIATIVIHSKKKRGKSYE